MIAASLLAWECGDTRAISWFLVGLALATLAAAAFARETAGRDLR